MRFTVGFFTAKQAEIDKPQIGESFAILQTITVNAPTETEAIRLAKGRADLPRLRAELTRRFPAAKIINYTVQRAGKNQPRTWLRSFSSWRIIE